MTAAFLQRALTRQSARVWQRRPESVARTTLRTSAASFSTQAPLLTQLAASESSQSDNEAKGIRALLAAAGGLFLAGGMYQNRTDCCGIAGVVGAPHHDARYVNMHM
jgi:hypothetical protein